MRTPETLTAAQRAERLRALAPGDWPDSDQAIAEHPLMSGKQSSLDRARASLMSSLSQRPSASAHLDPRAEIDGSISILSIDDIDFYEHNPRVSKNPKYAEIRQSIVADGITNMLTVTRRPGGTKYFPYGGGNTRLEIAKELHAQGDSRFAQLRVGIKTWRSEFDVVAAHLVENENRGDTSFWEKARGVHTFKAEFDRENPDQSLIGAELNRELGKRGMNFGVKMIQNFLFAVEHLSPVGPWLRAQDVNAVLRPRLAEHLEVAGRFDRSNEAGRLFHAQLKDAAAGLRDLEERNRLRDPSEHVLVELSAQRVVQDMASALADLLGFERSVFERMSAALANDPRLQSKDLLALDVKPQAPTPAAAYTDAGAGAQARAANPAAAPAASKSIPAAASGPAQRPLGAMAGVVGGTDAKRPAEAQHVRAQQLDPGREAGAASVDEDRAPHASLDERRGRLRSQLVQTITEVNGVVAIHDFMLAIESMPFGFLVDIPVNLGQIGELDVSSQMEQRGMLWHLLASLSGQLHEEHWRAAADDPLVAGTRWAQAHAQGAMPFAHTLGHSVFAACGLVDAAHGIFELHIPANVLWTLLSDPQLGPPLSRVIELRRALQLLEPDRHVLRGVQLRFEPTDGSPEGSAQ